MKCALKFLGLSVLTAAPIYRRLQVRAQRGNPVTILCYHTMRADDDLMESWLAVRMRDFRAQVAFLRSHYDIVSLDEALAPSDSKRPRAVLTFDDGEAAMYDLLLPFVEAEKLPVTVYVATGQVETGQAYWFDQVINALQHDGTRQINMTSQGLGTWDIGPEKGKERWVQIGTILEALKTRPEAERAVLAQLIAKQGSPAPVGVSPCRPMSIDQLTALAKSDYVTIGAHSHGHELLDQIPLDEARASILRSKELLEGWTGKSIRHFAYPNGNYSTDLTEVLGGLDFASATILEDRLARRGDEAFALPRVSVGCYDVLKRLKLRLVGL